MTTNTEIVMKFVTADGVVTGHIDGYMFEDFFTIDTEGASIAELTAAYLGRDVDGVGVMFFKVAA